MRTLLTQMAKAFPGQDLLVIAYAPSEPPLKIRTAQFNARTRQMTYTPAVRQELLTKEQEAVCLAPWMTSCVAWADAVYR